MDENWVRRDALTLSREVWVLQNKIRQDPQWLVPYLKGYLEMWKRHGREDFPACEEAIEFCQNQPALHALQWSHPLHCTACDHVDDQGPHGTTGHHASDGSSPKARFKRYGQAKDPAESISYSYKHALHIMIGLIVDDNIESRWHRQGVFSEKYNFVGVAVGVHKKYEVMCVIDYARKVVPNEMSREISPCTIIGGWGDLPKIREEVSRIKKAVVVKDAQPKPSYPEETDVKRSVPSFIAEAVQSNEKEIVEVLPSKKQDVDEATTPIDEPTETDTLETEVPISAISEEVEEIQEIPEKIEVENNSEKDKEDVLEKIMKRLVEPPNRSLSTDNATSPESLQTEDSVQSANPAQASKDVSSTPDLLVQSESSMKSEEVPNNDEIEAKELSEIHADATEHLDPDQPLSSYSGDHSLDDRQPFTYTKEHALEESTELTETHDDEQRNHERSIAIHQEHPEALVEEKIIDKKEIVSDVENPKPVINDNHTETKNETNDHLLVEESPELDESDSKQGSSDVSTSPKMRAFDNMQELVTYSEDPSAELGGTEEPEPAPSGCCCWRSKPAKTQVDAETIGVEVEVGGEKVVIYE